MKRVLTSVAIASAMFAGGAMAQSAKFTAAYNDSIDSDFVRSEACASTVEGLCEELGVEANDTNEVVVRMASIKMPNAKELMIGLSAQVALFTSTQAKGKRGTYSKAVAAAEGGVSLYACNEKAQVAECFDAAPGYVTLASRSQTLEAILAGVIEDCDVEVTLIDTNEDGFPDDASGEFSLSDCDVLDEMIALGIDTMSANHFNFLLPNLPQGDYTIYAKFQTEASATAEASCFYTYEGEDPLGCEDSDGSATGKAHAYIGKYMMTAQAVRAVKADDFEPMIVVD